MVEIPCSGKSAKSKTLNYVFTFFFKFRFKKSLFWIFKKNVKYVFSNYGHRGHVPPPNQWPAEVVGSGRLC